MALVKVDEGVYINPAYVAFICKQGKMGHPMDQDPKAPNDNVVKIMTGDIFIVKMDTDELSEKFNESF